MAGYVTPNRLTGGLFDPGHFSKAVAIKKEMSSLAHGEPPPYDVQNCCHLLLIDMFGSEPGGITFRNHLLSGQFVCGLTTLKYVCPDSEVPTRIRPETEQGSRRANNVYAVP